MNLLKRFKRVSKKRSSKSKSTIIKPSMSMSLTELQMMARKKGIAFGGLTKKELVKLLLKYIV